MRFIVPFASLFIAGQTIIGWAIRGAKLIGEIVLKINNNLIGKKLPNPIRTMEKNQCRKSQVYLTFLLLIVNQSTIAAKGI